MCITFERYGVLQIIRVKTLRVSCTDIIIFRRKLVRKILFEARQ